MFYNVFLPFRPVVSNVFLYDFRGGSGSGFITFFKCFVVLFSFCQFVAFFAFSVVLSLFCFFMFFCFSKVPWGCLRGALMVAYRCL